MVLYSRFKWWKNSRSKITLDCPFKRLQILLGMFLILLTYLNFKKVLRRGSCFRFSYEFDKWRNPAIALVLGFELLIYEEKFYTNLLTRPCLYLFLYCWCFFNIWNLWKFSSSKDTSDFFFFIGSKSYEHFP